MYTATLTPQNEGAYTVSIAARVARDNAFNRNLASEEATGNYDVTSAHVVSIVRQSPTEEVTHQDQLTWRVTFSEEVTDVASADFTLAGTTATLSVAAEGTSASVYDVTAKDGDLADLDGTVTLGFAADATIPDLAGNALGSTVPSGTSQPTYVLDNTNAAPTVARPLADLLLQVGDTQTIALEASGLEVFTDGDGDPLQYQVASSDTAAATATLNTQTQTISVAAGGRRDGDDHRHRDGLPMRRR